MSDSPEASNTTSAVSETTATKQRMERIEWLLRELQYNIEYGIRSGDLPYEAIKFQFYCPSGQIDHYLVRGRFETTWVSPIWKATIDANSSFDGKASFRTLTGDWPRPGRASPDPAERKSDGNSDS